MSDSENQGADYAGNLLAVMHGDGGHYISDHGWKKATDDAMQKHYALEATITTLKAQLAAAEGERDDYHTRKDGAYEERNRVVALLASLFPSGLARTAIEGWDEEWHNCVYIDTPKGQLSWHFHDSQVHLFEHLPPYEGEWDGHDTPMKYERVAALSAPASDTGSEEGGDA